MAIVGLSDLKDLVFPSLWDADEINKVRLQEGVTFGAVVAEIQAGFGILNGTLMTMPHYGDLFAVQDDMLVEYPVGVNNGFEKSTEYGLPTPQRGAQTGHMLPLDGYDRGLGWTQMFLRKSKRSQLDTDIRSAVADGKGLWQKALLTRMFKMEAENVGATANGSSVPLADGGTADSDYVPPVSPEGEAFANTHNHFLCAAALNATALGTMVETLQEHGHVSPFDLCGAHVDAAAWRAITGYKAPDWPGIVYYNAKDATADRAMISDVSQFFGYIETDYGIVRLWLTPRVPTKYSTLWKTYGPGDRRNPLRVRIDRNMGFGFELVPGQYVNNPMELAMVHVEFGVGIGEDRTNGVCNFIDGGGAYVTPTIS